tara:strand:- start:3796 stop:4728 length:933 start_codon:yes stop_codon:yes gene_type:complete
MTKFPTQIVTIEGPDLSGKTTLYQKIHKKTNFLWNIQDRSFLSMICYARQFGRDTKSHRQGLKRELLNLNNRVIIVIPPKDELIRRLNVRGDEFQDKKSLCRLHSIFKDETKKIAAFPNVLVIEDVLSQDELADTCIEWLCSFDKGGIDSIGKATIDAVEACDGEATINVEFSPSIENDFSRVMEHPGEKDYYREILQKTTDIFAKEFSGDNPYNKPQGLDSRRFYYSSDSCISSVHFLIRNGLLKVLGVFRSTDVHRNASVDLRFLCHLSLQVAKVYKLPVSAIDISVRLNCAHIRYDLPSWNDNEEVK